MTQTPDTDAVVTKMTDTFASYAKGKLYIEDVHVSMVHLAETFKSVERERNEARTAQESIADKRNARKRMERAVTGSAEWWTALDDLRRAESKLG